jgi:SAM-dependent methyltransferase
VKRNPALPYLRTSLPGWEAIWAEDTGGYGDDRLRRSRAMQKAALIRQLGVDESPGTRVLEVGSGIGSVSAAVASDIQNVCLLDWSMEALRRTPSELSGIRADICSIPFADESFDILIAACVVEHVAGRGRAIKEMVRVMAPDGKLFVIFSHRRSLAELFRPLHHLQGRYQCGYMSATCLEEELPDYLNFGLCLEAFEYLPAMDDLSIAQRLDKLLSRHGHVWSRYVGVKFSKPARAHRERGQL